jgi:hypothetical protein
MKSASDICSEDQSFRQCSDDVIVRDLAIVISWDLNDSISDSFLPWDLKIKHSFSVAQRDVSASGQYVLHKNLKRCRPPRLCLPRFLACVADYPSRLFINVPIQISVARSHRR